MGKLSNVVAGGIALGLLGLTAYSYKKKYDALKKDQGSSENEERGYMNIDKEAATEAAKQTLDEVKKQTVRAYGVVKESAKVIYDNVMTEYGTDIENGKAFATEKAGEFKEYASDKLDELKGKAGDVYEDLKDKASVKLEDVKEQAKKAYDSAKEKFAGSDGDDLEKTVEVISDDVKDEAEEAEASVEDLAKKADDFVQKL